MKNKLLFAQIAIVVAFTLAFISSERFRQGDAFTLFSPTVSSKIQSAAYGRLTDLKFQYRGNREVKSPLTIVEIDDVSISKLGRWPWRRDVTALLLESIFEFNPKAVGLDIVFSEYEEVFSEALKSEMKEKKIDFTPYDRDPKLWAAIEKYRDRLVIGTMVTDQVQPLLFSDKDALRKGIVTEAKPDDAAAIDPFQKFSYGRLEFSKKFDIANSRLIWMNDVLVNVPEISLTAEHQGLLNTEADTDGVVRRVPLVWVQEGRWFSGLGLGLYTVFSGEKPVVRLDDHDRVASIVFEPSRKKVNVSYSGVFEPDFPGIREVTAKALEEHPEASVSELNSVFRYVRAIDIICASQNGAAIPGCSGGAQTEGDSNRSPAAVSVKTASQVKNLLEGGAILVGVSATGAFDMRSFPYAASVPGVEGHATIFENLHSGGGLVTPKGTLYLLIMALAMAMLGLALAHGLNRLGSVMGVVVFSAFCTLTVFFDFHWLFSKQGILINSGWFYLQVATLFVVTFTAKYITEERSKKFVKDAFGKYLSPVLVDSIIKDPSKLSLGGEKRELTILFSDIRSFTTFSEKLDPKQLAQFLNDYLGKMTDIVFEKEGTLDKYIGDAVMAFWGAPLNQPNHAANAARAAVAMIQKMRAERARWKSEYGIDVDVGVGINSGPVNVGNMGSERIFEYTVIGDHVNLASRLEGLTKTYGVAVLSTRFTIDQIEKCGEKAPEYRTLDFVKVKGKKEAVELIEICVDERSPEAVSEYGEALKLYRAQAWNEAIMRFEKANVLLGGNDKPTLEMIQRCRDFSVAPPAADWDGSWEMHSK